MEGGLLAIGVLILFLWKCSCLFTFLIVFNEWMLHFSGGFMLIYDQRERKLLHSIDFRVTRSKHKTVGVPGFVAGLALAHQHHGSLSWKQLVEPAENFARYTSYFPFYTWRSYKMQKKKSSKLYQLKNYSRNGFHVSQTLLESRAYLDRISPSNKNLREYLYSLVLDEYLPNGQLADTLYEIGNNGSDGKFLNVC